MAVRTQTKPARYSRDDLPTVPVLSTWLGSWNVSLSRRAHTSGHLAKRYDALAESWDDTLDQFDAAQAYRTVLAKALPDAIVFADGDALSVLDCGTGTGAFLAAFDDMVYGSPKLNGIDVSLAMASKARENLARQSRDADIRVGDLAMLPYANASFDVVLAAHVVEHLADPRVALSEMFRVLKPGGTVVLCVTRASMMGRAIQFRWRTHTMTEGGATAWLHQAGFKTIRPLRALSAGAFDLASIACVATKPNAGDDHV